MKLTSSCKTPSQVDGFFRLEFLPQQLTLYNEKLMGLAFTCSVRLMQSYKRNFPIAFTALI